MRWLPLPLLIVLVACGSSPTRPTPPPPTGVTITGSITDTVTGAPVGTFTHEAGSLPAFVAVSAPGYVTRGAWIATARPTVDVIPEAGFDLAFYRQFLRGALEGRSSALRVLSASPAVYLQTDGLSPTVVTTLEQVVRAVIPALTGGKLQLASWETGSGARPARAGWIHVEIVSDSARPCGEATIGAPAGQVWLNVGRATCTRPLQHTFAHEIGHALGFEHVDDDGDLMKNPRPLAHDGMPSARERHHGAIAYKRASGNLDVDTDARNAEIFSLTRIVVD